jgi:hypothetical protein
MKNLRHIAIIISLVFFTLSGNAKSKTNEPDEYTLSEIKGELDNLIGKKITFSMVLNTRNKHSVNPKVYSRAKGSHFYRVSGSSQTYIAIRPSTLDEALQKPYEGQKIWATGKVHLISINEENKKKKNYRPKKAYVIAVYSIKPYYDLTILKSPPELSEYKQKEMKEIIFGNYSQSGEKTYLPLKYHSIIKLRNESFRRMNINQADWLIVRPKGSHSDIIYIFINKNQKDDIETIKALSTGRDMHIYGRIAVVAYYNQDRFAIVADKVLSEKWVETKTKEAKKEIAPPKSSSPPSSPSVDSRPPLRITMADLASAPDKYRHRTVKFLMPFTGKRRVKPKEIRKADELKSTKWILLKTNRTMLKNFFIIYPKSPEFSSKIKGKKWQTPMLITGKLNKVAINDKRGGNVFIISNIENQ